MAKPPRPKSFDESRIRRKDVYRQEYPPKANLPHPVVRGIVRGLLLFFLIPERRKAIDEVFFDVIEEALIAHGERFDCENIDHNDKINQLKDSVVDLIKGLLAHPTMDVLAEECTRLFPRFDEYTSLRGKIPRKNWLNQHLPDILASLLQGSRCILLQARGPGRPGCPRRKDMPTQPELDKWASKNGVREAIFHILAHHHGSTYAIVKERYDRSTPRRAHRNKGPLKPENAKPDEFE